MTTNQPPSSADDITRLSASLDEELKDIISDMTEVLDRADFTPAPLPETAPTPIEAEGPDEVILPDEFELPEPDAPPPPEPWPGPAILADDFEAAAADISPADDHDQAFDLELGPGTEIEIVDMELTEMETDDFDSPLPDFNPDDWNDSPEEDGPFDRRPVFAAAPTDEREEADERLTVRVGDLSVREFSRLIERAVARGVRQALRVKGGDRDDS